MEENVNLDALGKVKALGETAKEKVMEQVAILKTKEGRDVFVGKAKDTASKAKDLASEQIAQLKTKEGRDAFIGKVKESATNTREKILRTWKSGMAGKAALVGAVLMFMVCGSCLFNGGSAVTFTELSEAPFLLAFGSNAETKPGSAYKHSESVYIKALRVEPSGVIAGYVRGSGGALFDGIADSTEFFSALTGAGNFDKLIYIKTKTQYKDRQNIASGVYVRTGTYSFAHKGVKHVIEAFSELTAPSELKRIERIEQEKIKKLERDALAAEGKPISPDLPVKSICGFDLGSMPSQNWHKIKENDDVPFTHFYDTSIRTKIRGTPKEPFRHFNEVTLTFSTLGDRLESVQFDSDRIGTALPEEFARVKNLIEKKYGIKFEDGDDRFCQWRVKDEKNPNFEKEAIFLSCDYPHGTLQLSLQCLCMDELANEVCRDVVERPALPEDEGMDKL